MRIKISKFRKGWKKLIGGKMFYSQAGTDEETFRTLVASLLSRWETIKAANGEWTESEIDAAYRAVEISRRGSLASERSGENGQSTSAARSYSQASTALFLYAAIEKYLKQLKTAVPKQISIDHYEKSEQQVRRLKKIMPDVPIDQIEYDDLVRMKNAVINGKRINGKQFAVDTIITIMSCIKAFFNYLADSGDWQPPRGFDRAVKVDRARLAADSWVEDEEDDDVNVDVASAFSPSELANLWGIAVTDVGRMILGLGLFAGFTAMDIATLRKKMIIIEGEDLYILRKRQKTQYKQKYRTKWWIPPEIATLIRRFLLSTSDDPQCNPEGLLLLTSNNLPVVHRGPSGMGRKTDNVRVIWESIIQAAQLSGKSRWLSHKHLRKTGGRFIRYGVNEWKGAGLDTTTQLLAHAIKTVAEKNYIGRPDFGNLHSAQRSLYVHLAPVMFAKKEMHPLKNRLANVA